MRKRFLATALSLAMATLCSATAAQATVYAYTFESFDTQLTMTGTMTVDGGNMITAMSGSLSGLVSQTVDTVTPNLNFPGQATSLDGRFYYDNLFVSGNPSLDLGGVLFTTQENNAGYWNLWGNGADNYSLYESVSGGYPIAETGLFTVTAGPDNGNNGLDGLGAPAADAAHGPAGMFALGALLLCAHRRRLDAKA